MIPRLRRDDDPAPRSADLVEGWLRVFLGLLKRPEMQAAPIREELESHLRERIRDLMLAGTTEGEATRQAISELGEAADVAARYRALRTEPRRRLIMHATLFTVAGAALALSIAALRGGQPPQPEPTAEAAKTAAVQTYLQAILTAPDMTRRQPAELPLLTDRAMARSSVLAPQADLPLIRALFAAGQGAAARAESVAYVPQPVPPELADLKLDWDLKEAPLADAFEFLGQSAKLPLHVHWKLFEGAGVQRETPITVRARQAGVGAFVRIVNETTGAAGGGAMDVRVGDGALEIATREYFDHRERELVSYDLSGIIAARQTTYNEDRNKVTTEVSEAITQFVSPEIWKANGGDLAEMSIVGDRLFVNAPARLHPQIRWILAQLPAGKPRADAAPTRTNTGGATVVQVYPLKHTAADELIVVLRKMETIRSIDFGRVVCDARSNSIICSATPLEQAMFRVALESLDRPAPENRKGERGARPAEGAPVVLAQPVNAEVVYLAGEVSRPGTYNLPADGITIRRLLAAAGGFTDAATRVVISESRDGSAVVLRQIPVADLQKDDGPDPAVTRGQLVSVRN